MKFHFLTLSKFFFRLFSILLIFQGMMCRANEKLVVGLTPSPPFSFQNDDHEWTGISVDLWESIANQTGLNYEYRSYSLPELLLALEKGEADVGAAALVTTAEREKVMDFSHAFFTSGLSIATPVESQSTFLAFGRKLLSMKFVYALSVLGLVLFMVGFVIWLLEKKSNRDQFSQSPIAGLGDGFWWSAVTMTTVGYGDKAPATLAGRIVGIIWMFASIILISGFTGAIASALTVNELKPRITGLNDLHTARVGVIDGSQAAEFLETQHILYQSFRDTEAGLKAVESGLLDGFVNDIPVLLYYVRKNHQGKLIVLKSVFGEGYYALALKENSPHLREINVKLLEHIQSTNWPGTLKKYLGQQKE